MLVILVASSKGGCGKTTTATHLAAYFALAGKRTVLDDADPQRSSLRWCERRAALDHAALPVNGCRRGWQKLIPADTQRLIVDAPAGAMASDLESFIAEVDAIVVPVLPSVIDMDASIEFLASLTGSERVRRHKVAVGLVGNRTKPWTSANANALTQIETWPYPLVTSLRDSQAYGLLSGLGRSLFDYRSQNVRRQKQDWDALMNWLRLVKKARLNPCAECSVASLNWRAALLRGCSGRVLKLQRQRRGSDALRRASLPAPQTVTRWKCERQQTDRIAAAPI